MGRALWLYDGINAFNTTRDNLKMRNTKQFFTAILLTLLTGVATAQWIFLHLEQHIIGNSPER